MAEDKSHVYDWDDSASSDDGAGTGIDKPSTFRLKPSASIRAGKPTPSSKGEGSGADEPPKKQPKRSVPIASSSAPAQQPQTPETDAESLSKVIQVLAKHPTRERITKVCETVSTVRTPTKRVHLPALTDFKLTIQLPPLSSSFKTVVKSKLAHLEDLIFFNKEDGDDGRSSILPRLMCSGVTNIQISTMNPNSSLLNLNGKESSILLHLVKDAETILNGAAGIPIQALYLSELELKTLVPIRTDFLKHLVIWRVDGLRDHYEFLRKCPNLQSISWNRFGKEFIRLNELTAVLKELRKVALAEADVNFTLAENLPGPYAPQKLGDNKITELYLDRCTFEQEWYLKMGVLFPHLEKIYMSGTHVHALLLYNTLSVPTIKWIFLWEFAFSFFGEEKKKQLTQESKQVLEFLETVLGKKMEERKAYTFLLEKNGPASANAEAAAAQGTTLDAAGWRGQIFKGVEQYRKVNEIDFQVFGYGNFYGSFEDFFNAEKKNRRRI